MAFEDMKTIEAKWQKIWKDTQAFKTTSDPAKPNFYALDMFPYPSGSGLHVGHCEGYTATDVLARLRRMQGYNVLHPMGWDAFGLPAENYALKTGIHPRETTAAAIANFRRQIDSVGFSYDWETEVNTTDPAYYKWTQWIFLQLFKQGLAYESVIPINWCPSCKTGLANEEVNSGKCDRCGQQVQRKDMRQWMLRITQYADRLLADLSEVDWPESTLAMQRNWIGRSEGAEVTFAVAPGYAPSVQITVFTTRPDTLFGATYMVLSPEHALVEKITTPECKASVAAYQAQARFKSDLERTELTKEKTGSFTGAYALNPVNNKQIPIWIADYVLATYGTGAIMAVPAHDERDFAFAQKYGIPILEVVAPVKGKTALPDAAFVDAGIAVNSGLLDGMATSVAKATMITWLSDTGFGKGSVTYRLRDWVFSRQRYWGEPIPVVHCGTCGVVPVHESELPVLLPEVQSYEPSGTGESPLATIASWVTTTCPTCKGPARRETNTMPQWAGSCWYYLRYLDPKNAEHAWSAAREKQWMNVDLYVGGAEHAVLHLLYSRFWHKVLFDLGYVSTLEPFKKLRHQGTVLARTYRDAVGKYHEFSEVTIKNDLPYLTITGELLTSEVEKMAKSKLNGVNPDDVVATSGADVLRLYELFMGEFELPKPWDPRAIEGCVRFLRRVMRLVDEFDAAVVGSADTHERLRHKTIKKVSADLEAMKFNTAIARLMEYINALITVKPTRDDLTTLVLLMAPFAPHVAEELWERLGGAGLIAHAPWPIFNAALCEDDTLTIVVQVNGKLREQFTVARDATSEMLESTALSLEKVKAAVVGKTIKKVVVVPNKLVNVVVG